MEMTPVPELPTEPPAPPRRSFSDRGHPFYRPLWRRIAIVAFTGTWALVEWLYLGNGIFKFLILGLFAYAVWVFLLTWDDKA